MNGVKLASASHPAGTVEEVASSIRAQLHQLQASPTRLSASELTVRQREATP